MTDSRVSFSSDAAEDVIDRIPDFGSRGFSLFCRRALLQIRCHRVLLIGSEVIIGAQSNLAALVGESHL